MTATVELGRTQAVHYTLEVLEDATLDDIVDFLKSENRDDPKHLVSAALAGLKKAGKAHSVGHGRWAPGAGGEERHGPTAPTSPAPVRRARRDEEYCEVWVCAKECGHTYESPLPVNTVWHTRCPKARSNGDWIPLKKRNP